MESGPEEASNGAVTWRRKDTELDSRGFGVQGEQDEQMDETTHDVQEPVRRLTEGCLPQRVTGRGSRGVRGRSGAAGARL